MRESKTIEVLLHDGSLTGIREMSFGDGNCKCFVIPKSELDSLDAEHQKELKRADALYFLLGDNQQVYVGETNDAHGRVHYHSNNKKFWHTAIVFLSKSSRVPLGKDRIKYYEYLAYNLIGESGFQLLNEQAPRKHEMSKFDRSRATPSFNEIKMLTKFLGHAFLEPQQEAAAARKPAATLQPTPKRASQPQSEHANTPLSDIFYCTVGGITKATGKYNPATKEMVVLANSTIVKAVKSTLSDSEQKNRQETLSQYATDEGSYYKLKEDLPFSLHLATILCVGGRASGYTVWLDADKRKLGNVYPRNGSDRAAGAENRFYCQKKGGSVDAEGVYADGGFRVLASSKIAKGDQSSYRHSQQRAELIQKHATDKGDHYVLNNDVEFPSPSGASDFCCGTHTNGWNYWLRKSDNKPLKEVFPKGK